MGIKNLKEIRGSNSANQSLRVNKAKGKISAELIIFDFIDKDTQQIVLYCPAFELSSYGENYEKAKEMMALSLEDYFNQLIKLPIDKIQLELVQYGWKKAQLSNKTYSKAYVDIDGKLKDFNALEDKVEAKVLAF